MSNIWLSYTSNTSAMLRSNYTRRKPHFRRIKVVFKIFIHRALFSLYSMSSPRFEGYCCKSGIVLFAYSVTWNYAYRFNQWVVVSRMICILVLNSLNRVSSELFLSRETISLFRWKPWTPDLVIIKNKVGSENSFHVWIGHPSFSREYFN